MSSSKPSKYHLVPDTDLDVSTTEKTSQERRRAFGWGAIAIYMLFGAAITAGVVSAFNSKQCPTTRYKQFVTSPCGHSAAEAKAGGCIFDPMMNSWLSEDCYDEELSREWRSLRDWTFFTDENRTRQLSESEFSKIGDSWGSWEYHITHCMFAMRKVQRAVTKGRKIERIVAAEEHTTHCANVMNVTFTLMERAHSRGEDFSLQDMGTVLHTGYPMCIDSINLLPYRGVVT